MKISELIEQLEQIKEKHGDLPLELDDIRRVHSVVPYAEGGYGVQEGREAVTATIFGIHKAL